jgi:hypothetical protein
MARSLEERVWRLRKLHQYVDAELRDEGGAGVRVQFFFNGEPVLGRRWPTRALALLEAAGKRAELERDGWMAHW